MSTQRRESYEFGPFRLDVNRRVLTREGLPVALAPKTLDLLLLLVGSPGLAFSRQALMASLWPDTVVEEANLSFQVSTLRKALASGGPPWIETVPKHGYRFSGDVIVLPPGNLESTPPAVPVPAPPLTEPARRRIPSWLRALLIAAVVGSGAYAIHFRGAPSSQLDNTAAFATPLTAYSGDELAPSLSPDGSQVAFSWNGPKHDNYDIYVKVVGPGEPLAVTSNPARDDRPAWSPDGRQIAFLRYSIDPSLARAPAGPPDQPIALTSFVDLFVIPALGGAERRIATILMSPRLARSYPVANLAWTPDGKWLAVGGRLSASGSSGIWLIAVDGPERRQLTEAPLQRMDAIGDASPAFSADGSRMAFIRESSLSSSQNDIYVVPLSSDLRVAGTPVQVATDAPRAALGVAWMPGDRGLVFSSGGHLGQSRMQRIALAAGTSNPVGGLEVLPFGERATVITASRSGRLVYSAESRDTNLWRLNLTGGGAAPEDLGLSSSTFDEHTPDYSPDGERLAFASTRSGAEEIWISQADGSSPRQMTSIKGPLCANPQWSPDGQTILFNSRREGSSDLYLLWPATGEVRRLTTAQQQEELEARWSRDGKWIYFGSDRTGSFEVWKMPAEGGSLAIQVTHGGGLAARESPDGRFLYYAKAPVVPTAIWRVPISGGEETLVADGLSYSLNFAVGARGLYLVALDAARRPTIDFVEYSTGRRTTLAVVPKPFWWGVALSPDQQRLLFPVVESAGSNLMLVDKVQ
jgi:Tol biopolymer transport system component/DNA-binding winged helix-turn-helix (wHTH) protein